MVCAGLRSVVFALLPSVISLDPCSLCSWRSSFRLVLLQSVVFVVFDMSCPDVLEPSVTMSFRSFFVAQNMCRIGTLRQSGPDVRFLVRSWHWRRGWRGRQRCRGRRSAGADGSCSPSEGAATEAAGLLAEDCSRQELRSEGQAAEGRVVAVRCADARGAHVHEGLRF